MGNASDPSDVGAELAEARRRVCARVPPRHCARSRQVDARQEVVLRIGDASNFDLTINGLPTRRLGAPGEAVTVSITPQNAQQFLAQ